MRILGVDPGLRNLGWGVIETQGNQLKYLGCGVVATKASQSLPQRLNELYSGLGDVCDKFQPDEVSVETVFVNKDAQATLKLVHARALCLLIPAQRGWPVAQYAPNTVKKTVVGVGHADKEQIRYMIKRLLPQAQLGKHDTSDALAIALCHAYHVRVDKILRRDDDR